MICGKMLQKSTSGSGLFRLIPARFCSAVRVGVCRRRVRAGHPLAHAFPPVLTATIAGAPKIQAMIWEQGTSD
jgi:hypothetical protein